MCTSAPEKIDLKTVSAARCVTVDDNVQAQEDLEDQPGEKDRRSQELVAYVGHELRNTLAPMYYALEILNHQTIDNASLSEVRDVLMHQMSQMRLLVDDLLTLPRLTDGKIQLQKETIALSDVLTRAIETSRPGIDSHGHQLFVSLPREPIHLEADGARLVQVFANLLNNASKYSDGKGTIYVVARQNAAEAVISVHDSGVGIAHDMLPVVFDIFRQESRSWQKSHGGFGIGLFVVRKLVELHGGTVRAQSAGLGAGSTFTVKLPCLLLMHE